MFNGCDPVSAELLEGKLIKRLQSRTESRLFLYLEMTYCEFVGEGVVLFKVLVVGVDCKWVGFCGKRLLFFLFLCLPLFIPF